MFLARLSTGTKQPAVTSNHLADVNKTEQTRTKTTQKTYTTVEVKCIHKLLQTKLKLGQNTCRRCS